MTRTFRSFSLLTTALLGVNIVCAQVVINEVNVSNLTGLSATNPIDGDTEFEDWVELFNTSGSAVDLSGYHLSDDPAEPLKWVFPAGATIAANGRMVILCSSWDGLYGGTYSTNFKLTQASQDHVVFSDAGGTIIEDIILNPPTKTDQSRGRTPDGAANWMLLPTPTPNAANGASSPEYTANVDMSPAPGFYGGAQSVTITGPAGATIRYTTNGDEPTAASTAYAGAINVGTTTVIRAAAFNNTPGVPPSFIETNTYFINSPHQVAVLSIAGDQLDDLLGGNGGIQPFGSFEYFGPDGVLRDEAVGSFNEHGQDSWAYDQRGFDYVVRDQTGYTDAIHYPVFRGSDRDKYQRLIVKALAGDNVAFGPGNPAHIRDPYVQALSQLGNLHLDERSYEPAVLYMNGQYWGVYDMREKVDDADFTKYYYDQDENNLFFVKTWGGTWQEYGGTPAINDWNALKAYINANDMGDPAAFAYVESQLNWKSLLDYFCLNSYTVCADWLNWNTAWWRGLNVDGEHRKWGYALWDLDATFGHYGNFTGIPDQTANADPCTPENLGDPGGQGHTVIINKLITENQMVHDWYVNRYIDLGNTTFSCVTMNHLLDSLLAMVTPEMPAQCARWGVPYATWQANVQIMRDFIDARCITTQQGMVDCYDLTGPYDVVFKVQPPLSGEIKVNSVVLPSYPFSGVYYGQINTELEALEAAGWTFDHWEATNHVLTPSMLDSIGSLTFTASDTIIAHFKPPISLEIVLMTDPDDKAIIEFNGLQYASFPVTVGVAEAVPIPMTVSPNEFYDFLYWEVKHNIPNTNDSTQRSIAVTFYTGDTIIAHLRPQEYGYWAPNAFTPNGDLINDVWQPWGNVIELESFELQVFDRWGEMIWEARDPRKSWDGTFGGGAVPPGVYAFRGKAIEAISKEKHDLSGHVSVIR